MEWWLACCCENWSDSVLGLAGFSVALSSRGVSGQLARAARIFGAGMLVSFVTWIFAGDAFVKFGVLHFIGVAVVIAAWFKSRPRAALCVAAGSFILGEYFKTLVVGVGFLFPIGLVPLGFLHSTISRFFRGWRSYWSAWLWESFTRVSGSTAKFFALVDGKAFTCNLLDSPADFDWSLVGSEKCFVIPGKF